MTDDEESSGKDQDAWAFFAVMQKFVWKVVNPGMLVVK